MKMKEMIEVTEWDIPNNTYYVCAEKGKLLGKLMGYKVSGTSDIFWFSVPMKFDVRYRKFNTKQVSLEIK
jgi:hypothetical protein